MTANVPTFDFRTAPAIHVEWGGAAELGDRLADWCSARRVLLVTDGGLRAAGIVDPVEASLARAGFELAVFDEVVADPPEAVALACAQRAREHAAELILGLGGGSSLDVAKLTAVLAHSDQPLAEMYGIGKVVGERLPLVQIPTTAGTGSEVTDIVVLTTGETTKLGIVSPQLFADHVLLDAQLTLGLPPAATAATGIDAMVHAIEASTSRHKKNPISDALAREALRLLGAHLVRACTDGGDREAREAMLLGATLAGQAFANAPVAAVHALAYPLGGRYHIPHGLSNALMLGPVLRFNLSAAAGVYAGLGEVLLGPLPGSDEERAEAFLAHMESLMDRSGAPRRLREVEVEEAMLPTLAADAMLQTRLLDNNPIPVDEAAALELYRAAW